MNKRLRPIVWVAIVILGSSLLFAGPQVRKPAWADQFYDSDPVRLGAEIDGFIKAGSRPATGRWPLAIIVPHAGYQYSGGVAGKGYATVLGGDYETVAVIAPSHRVGFRGCSVENLDGLETPLGVAPVDKDLARLLQKESGFGYVAEAHASEHALEVQVPFIQKALPQAKILPIIMGTQDGDTARTLAEALSRLAKSKKLLVVASTDMSHFLTKKEANVLDASTIALVKSQSTAALLRKVERQGNILCGGGGVVAALLYAQKRGPAQVDVLQYADSSDAGTPEDRVVGYFAAAIYPQSKAEVSFSLSPAERRELLRIARQAIDQAVTSNSLLEYRTDNSNLLVPKGAFVTLTKKGMLRGCIGFIEPVYPLYQTIIQAACYAALQDSRFDPVSSAELKDLEIEISVLSPLTRISNVEFVQVGKHGLIMSQGDRKGLLLPQVAVENGWTRDQFLREACLKAGLNPDAWKKDAEIYAFEAIVFR